MATYKVLSDKVAGMDQGTSVQSSSFLEGTNLEALIAGGHLAEVGKVQEAKQTEVQPTEVKKLDKE